MKAIFITGGGSGIGAATARLFAEHGWFVGLADVNEAGLAATAATLPPERGATYAMDVRDRDAWAASLDAFTAITGRLDVLFNNAGIAVGGALEATSFEAIDRVVAINLMGVLNGAKIGRAYLAKTPGSCLLNTASASAIYGSAGLAPYSAAKFGVRALTEALDGEWAKDGIRVRDIIPGFIETPLLDTSPAGSNHTIRERVVHAGMELTPVEHVAEAAWDAVHGEQLHTLIGPTARRMAFATRWLPRVMRKRMRR